MAEPDLGWVDLGVRPDTTGFGTSLSRQVDGQMTSAGRSAAARFSAGFKRAAALGVAGGGLLALKVGKDSIAQASDLNESLNAVNVTYRKQATEVKALGREAAESLGLSNTEFNGLSVQFSGFVDQVAGSRGKVVGTLDDLTTRAADFASVMNLDVADAATLFQSGLAGETEPLRRYGIDLSAAAVAANAYKTGLAEAGVELTEQEKVQSRYSLLMQETSKAQGDFANTSDSLANRQRILNAQWDDAQAKLGTALLPVVEDFTGFLVDEGVPAFERFSDWFVKDGVPAIKGFADEVKPVLGYTKDFVGFLNDLPSEAKLAGVVGLLGAMGAAKFRGGGLGALGTIGQVAGFAKPVPVFVTNAAGLGLPGVTPGGSGKLSTAAKTAARYALPVAALGYSLNLVDNQLQEAAARRAAGTKNFEFDKLGYSNDIYLAMEKSGDKFASAFGASFSDSLADTFRAVGLGVLPNEIATNIAINGVPESKKAVRELFGLYDLTPKEKRTAFEIFGYDAVLDRAARIKRAYDEAAQDRRMKITVEYDNAGYQTRGGLQEFGGTTSRNRSRAGGGI